MVPSPALNGKPSSNGNGRNHRWQVSISVDHEEAVLAAALERNDIIPELRSKLPLDAIASYPLKVIYGIMLELHRKGQPVTLADLIELTMKSREDVPRGLLIELPNNAPHLENLAHHISKVREASKLRKMGRLGRGLVEESENPTGSVDEVFESYKKQFADLADGARDEQGLEALVSSALQATDPQLAWIMRDCIARGSVTLLSALWKAGKTTWLAHLLRTMENGGEFCGRTVAPGKVLVISEEHQGRWAERRDKLGIGDHVSFLIRPFMQKPGLGDWYRFVDGVAGLVAKEPRDLIIIDTVANLWPVADENDASLVQAALMPLHQLAKASALLLVHHLGKADGRQATGSRGSGALTAWVDAILELRRYAPEDHQDRRRVIHGFARWDTVPSELVIELAQDGTGYQAHGDRHDVTMGVLMRTLAETLPEQPPGMNYDEIREAWEPKPPPTKQILVNALHRGVDKGEIERGGPGTRGKPFTYWLRNCPE